MKLKKLLIMLLAMVLLAGFNTFTVFADDGEGEGELREDQIVLAEVIEIERQWLADSGRPWADTKWIQVHNRAGDYTGVQFDLPMFMDRIAEEYERTDEGFYRFIFVVSGGHKRLGNTYKVLTQDGDNSLAYVRFTDREARGGDDFPDEEEFVKITYDGDADNKIGGEVVYPKGMISAEYLWDARAHEQRMQIHTQSTEYDFEVREAIVEHYPDGEDGEAVEVYRMSTDPNIQEKELGEVFQGSDLGFIPAGTATFLIINAENMSPERIEPPHVCTDECEDPCPILAEQQAAIDAEGDTDTDSDTADVPDENAPATEDTPALPANVENNDTADDDGGFPLALVLGIGGGVVVLAVAGVIIVNKRK